MCTYMYIYTRDDHGKITFGWEISHLLYYQSEDQTPW